jgi:hypothetical protein
MLEISCRVKIKMNTFYVRFREAFQGYHCHLCGYDEIVLVPKLYVDFDTHYEMPDYKIETLISELGDFLKRTPCPYDNMRINFKIRIKDRFMETNCYGIVIPRTGTDVVGATNIKTCCFQTEEIINVIMKDVKKESFINIVDIDILFFGDVIV